MPSFNQFIPTELREFLGSVTNENEKHGEIQWKMREKERSMLLKLLEASVCVCVCIGVCVQVCV
jgi:hypothetical protein